MQHRKWLAVALVLCMLFGLMSITAYADNDAEGGDDSELITIIEEEELAIEPAADAPLADPVGEPELTVAGVLVTEANAANILGDGKVSFDAATSTLTFTAAPATSGKTLIKAVNMNLTVELPAGGLNVYCGEVDEGISVIGGTLTINGNLDIVVEGDQVTAIHVDRDLTVNGNLTGSASNYVANGGKNYGVKSDGGNVTITGDFFMYADFLSLYCANGNVTVGGNAELYCNSSNTNAGGIRAEQGSVEISGNYGFYQKGIAVYADGDITIGGTVQFGEKKVSSSGNTTYIRVSRGLYSENGQIVCEKDVTIYASNNLLTSANGEGGILIKGNAILNSPSSSSATAVAVKAGAGPFTVNGNLTMSCGGDPALYADKDITVDGNAIINSQTYNTNQYRNRAVVSNDGSITVSGSLECTSVNSSVYAKNDISVGGDTRLSFARASDSVTADYGLKAETGSISVAGKLEVLGKAFVSVFAGEDFTAAQDVTVNNIDETSVGVEALGVITFVSGKWDVTAGVTAIRAEEGVVIPVGYGVTLPENGLVVELDDGFAVTEADKTTVAAHAIISNELIQFYLIRPNWSLEGINAAELFVKNPDNANEYMLNTTLAVGDEIKVVRVENGAITGWWPDGEHTQYHVDEAHSGDVTIYFKTEYDGGWAEFGGYFYIAAQTVPTGFHINVTDYTKGAATTSIEAETLYTGEVTFTVSSGEEDKAVGVALINADGTLTRLACTTADGVHSYTITVDADVTIAIVFKGDFDLNGNVKSKDSTMLKQVMVGLKELDPETAALQIFSVDLNNDGVLQNKEATMVSQVIVESKAYTW